MELNFEFGTGSWIVGATLQKACGGTYKEHGNGQTLYIDRIRISKGRLNSELSKVPLITDSKTTQVTDNYQVIELIDIPAGDRFKMGNEEWKMFVEWLKSHDEAEVIYETEDEIELVGRSV